MQVIYNKFPRKENSPTQRIHMDQQVEKVFIKFLGEITKLSNLFCRYLRVSFQFHSQNSTWT
jgi:hypothetical protein